YDDFFDDNLERKAWAKLMTYRIIKFLEWFKSLGLNINLNFYDSPHDLIQECITDSGYLSDITIGVDYIDQFPELIYDFQILALCTTNLDGNIISLRTDGIPFSI